MTDRSPRVSTDQESAPLLRDSGEGTEANEHIQRPSEEGIHSESATKEQLTTLTKILLVLSIALLLTTAVFIGLFAGAQHRLAQRRRIPAPESTTTVTLPVTTSVISQTITLTEFPPAPTQAPEEKRCLEPPCIILSTSILSSLDTTQDPCENFYDYANGGWLKSHSLSADQSSIGQFEGLGKENKEIIKSILESSSASSGSIDDQLLKKLRHFFSSCLDESKLDEIGTAPLLHLVQAVRKLYNENAITTFSDAEKGKDKMRGLTRAVAFLHAKGIPALFSFDVDGDTGEDPNFMALWFNQPELGLPSKEYFEEKAIREIYADVLGRLLVVLLNKDDARKHKVWTPFFAKNRDSNYRPLWPLPPWRGNSDDNNNDMKPINRTEQAHKLAKKVVQFERKIARASLDLDVLRLDRMGTYNPVPISNLTGTIHQIHFPTYFSILTPGNYPKRVIVKWPEYMRSLAEILDETDPDVIEAYLVTRIALKLSPYLGTSTEVWQAQKSLLEALSGVKKGAVADRTEMCLNQLEESLGFAAGRFFVKETFGPDSKAKATKVMTDIVESFKESLNHNDWMDEESAIAAAEKADAIRIKVGFPLSPDTRDPRSIANYYSLVKADKTDFFGNVLSSLVSGTHKKWQKLGTRRDPESWRMMFPSTADAFFDVSSNEIVFPAGILRPPFFSPNWPHYLSYGSFGLIAAHELTHPFDSAGRMYDQEGKLRQWWTNATSEGFKVKEKCIVNQYAGYYILDDNGKKIHVNGNLTSGENIGDTGLIQAYRAWKRQYNASLEAGNEYLLPGLNYTRDQLFFISFARIWARKTTPAAAVQLIRTDPHSPTRFRVDGTVSNIPEFAEAFKCSKKARLNPPRKERCVFWG